MTDSHLFLAGFEDGNGEDVRPGDRVEYRFGARRGTLVEVFPDGDAIVDFDITGEDRWVKSRHLCKVPGWVEERERKAGR